MNLQELIQETLWKEAGKICRYKDKNGVRFRLCVAGLILLKYMSHAFEQLIQELKGNEGDYSGSGSELAEIHRYLEKNFLYIPRESRWEYILERANRVGIGSILDKAMENIERLNPTFRRILPREYASPNIREDQLALFIKKLGAIPKDYFRTGEILQGLYDYFVRNYPASEEEIRETLSTPGCVDKLLVAMVGPLRGSVFDPCCGVGSTLVKSHAFLSQQQNSTDGTVFYGQESKSTHFRLCRMNLAIHGINGTNIGCNNESSLDRDVHPDLKADYIFCAPIYNGNSSSSSLSWLRYIISHLAPKGIAGVILSQDSLLMDSAKGDWALENLVGDKSVDCIVTLPGKLFPAREISACLWILAGGKERRKSKEEVLLIDASSNIHGPPPALPGLSTADIGEIAEVYNHWQDKNGNYKDAKGFCKSVDWKSIKKQNLDLRPEKYV